MLTHPLCEHVYCVQSRIHQTLEVVEGRALDEVQHLNTAIKVDLCTQSEGGLQKCKTHVRVDG